MAQHQQPRLFSLQRFSMSNSTFNIKLHSPSGTAPALLRNIRPHDKAWCKALVPALHLVASDP